MPTVGRSCILILKKQSRRCIRNPSERSERPLRTPPTTSTSLCLGLQVSVHIAIYCSWLMDLRDWENLRYPCCLHSIHLEHRIFVATAWSPVCCIRGTNKRPISAVLQTRSRDFDGK